MTTAQPLYDYSAYDYSYETGSAAAYPSYPGYESNPSYQASNVYEGYATSGTYSTDTATGSSYGTVDPYTGYATAAYGYPSADTMTGATSSSSHQTGYPASYSSSPTRNSHAYESRRTSSPPSSSSSSSTHYTGYNYMYTGAGSYAPTSSSTNTYSPYKTISMKNSSSSQSDYATYATSSAPPPEGAYNVPSNGQLAEMMSLQQTYPSSTADMLSGQSDYYPSSQILHSMHYVQRQPQRMPHRLPPRGGYQRELDEPGDENTLLRHVIYITGLPKEIQNETLAEVFGTSCGLIAPVDIRSPKPKIWVYKDRQTREGKGEATITFINPESCQIAINYFNGKELFGRLIRVSLCPRRMYNMQKQNTPFNPAAPPMSTTTPIASMIRPASNTTTTDNSHSNNEVSTVSSTPSISTITSTVNSLSSPIPTTSSSSNIVTVANPISTISSSTHGLQRQSHHSLFKFRQTPDQQRGLLPTPANSFVAPMMNNALQRDGGRKELSRVALNRGNVNNLTGVRPKPY